MKPLRRVWPLMVVAALLAAAAIAAALSSPQIRSVPVARRLPRNPNIAPSMGEYPTPAGGGAAVQKPIVLPGWVSFLINAVCTAAICAVVGFLIWYVLRNQLAVRRERLRVEDDRPVAAHEHREKVLAAVDAGLADLDIGERDPRRAVIACWIRLEAAAAAVGTPKKVADSPTDLVVRLLSQHRVSAPVLYELAEVYRLARYATHTVDESMRDRARSALRQIRLDLTARPPAPEPEPADQVRGGTP